MNKKTDIKLQMVAEMILNGEPIKKINSAVKTMEEKE